MTGPHLASPILFQAGAWHRKKQREARCLIRLRQCVQKSVLPPTFALPREPVLSASYPRPNDSELDTTRVVSLCLSGGCDSLAARGRVTTGQQGSSAGDTETNRVRIPFATLQVPSRLAGPAGSSTRIRIQKA